MNLDIYLNLLHCVLSSAVVRHLLFLSQTVAKHGSWREEIKGMIRRNEMKGKDETFVVTLKKCLPFIIHRIMATKAGKVSASVCIDA